MPETQFSDVDTESEHDTSAEDVDFDGADGDDEAEDFTLADANGTTKEKTPKAPKEKARGDLPEGYVTPVGLAHELNRRKLGKTEVAEDGTEVYVEIPPQQVYSYIKNAPKAYPFPLETKQDSLGKDRQVVKIEAGVQWWEEKNERAAARRQNAAAKAAAKATKAAATPANGETPSEAAEEVVTEEAE